MVSMGEQPERRAPERTFGHVFSPMRDPQPKFTPQVTGRLRFLVVLGVIAVLDLLLAGCGSLDERPGSAATAARSAATALPARAATPQPPVRTATPPPVATRTPTPPPQDDSELEQSVADSRARLEKVLRSAALGGLEDILVETVALAAPSGGEQLPRATAARWLRQRASAQLRIVQFERHQHQPLIIASTQGWRALAPLSSSQLGFTLRRYAPSGAEDPDHGDWMIDVFEAE